jgi:hypothetical protein
MSTLLQMPGSSSRSCMCTHRETANVVLLQQLPCAVAVANLLKVLRGVLACSQEAASTAEAIMGDGTATCRSTATSAAVVAMHVKVAGLAPAAASIQTSLACPIACPAVSYAWNYSECKLCLPCSPTSVQLHSKCQLARCMLTCGCVLPDSLTAAGQQAGAHVISTCNTHTTVDTVMQPHLAALLVSDRPTSNSSGSGGWGTLLL